MELRPLDFAGIFNRAIALYSRYFLSLVALAVVMVAPVAALEYVIDLREQPQIDASIELLQHPDRLRTEHVPALSPDAMGMTVALVLFSYVMLSFAVATIGVAVAHLYRGEPPSFRTCYTAVIARWPAIVALVAAAMVVLAVSYVAAVIVAALPVVAVTAFAKTLLPLVLPLAISVMLFGIAFVLLMLGVTIALSIYGVVVEGYGATASLRLTAARVLNRAEFGRALLFGMAVGAIVSVAFAFVDTTALLALSRWPVAYVTVDACVRTLVVPFIALVLAVYYFDVRLRREVFGLNVGAELAAGADEPSYAPTAYLSSEERALVKRFLERRDTMNPPRRRAIAARLAEPVRPRLPEGLQTLDDESLLERLG